MQFRSFFAFLILCLCIRTTASTAELVYPNPDIAPAEVIAIQLNGLKHNDSPETDAGIRQTWEFAHPRNRAMTGPLKRFTTMLKGPGYDVMLNHASHEIVPANSGEGWRRFDVFMETEDGEVMQFAWIVEKVTDGRYKNCWMTVAVSAPRLAGRGS
jgi:hypothetical protein